VLVFLWSSESIDARFPARRSALHCGPWPGVPRNAHLAAVRVVADDRAVEVTQFNVRDDHVNWEVNHWSHRGLVILSPVRVPNAPTTDFSTRRGSHHTHPWLLVRCTIAQFHQPSCGLLPMEVKTPRRSDSSVKSTTNTICPSRPTPTYGRGPPPPRTHPDSGTTSGISRKS
jgi:hypothetical protein